MRTGPWLSQILSAYRMDRSPSALREARQQAWTRLREKSLPTSRDEAYRLTPLFSHWENRGVRRLPNPSHFQQTGFAKQSTSVRLIPWHEACQTHAHLLKNNLSKSRLIQQDPLACLNTLFAEQGAVLSIDKTETTPFTLPPFQHYGRYLIRAAAQTQTCLVQHQATRAEQDIQNGVYELSCGAGSKVTLYTFQKDDEGVIRANNLAVELDEGACFRHYMFSFSKGLTRNNVQVSLKGAGAAAFLYGLYLPTNDAHTDNHVEVVHAIGQTNSRQLYKGIVQDQARAVFQGKISILPQAQQCSAYQENKTLLCHPQATVHAQPQLEIEADDVKCSHGCTTGQLDEQALFYLQSRGMSQRQARQLLLSSFAQEIADEVQEKSVLNELQRDIQRVLAESS